MNLLANAQTQFSCNGTIYRFEQVASLNGGIHPECTPLVFEIELVNADVFPTGDLLLTLTVRPEQFQISPQATGGFPAVPVTNPTFPTLVDYVQTVNLAAEEPSFLVTFQATVPSTFNNFTNKVDVMLTLSPSPGTGSCSNDSDDYEMFPNTLTRQIGDANQVTSLQAVATDNPNDNTVDLNALFSVPSGNILALPPQDAVINGTLVIDMNYAFTEFSNLRLGPGAKLQVDLANSTFWVEGTKIKGCDEMWHSIEVSDDAYLALLDSEIEDGQVAVNLLEDGNVECTGNTFTNNGIGLAATGDIISLSFDGNTITSTGTLKAPLAAQNLPRAGVELVDVPFLVSLHGTAANHYSNLHNGIIATGTSLVVKNSDFVDITEVAATAGVPFSGHAIHVVNNIGSDRKLTQEGHGDGSTSPVSFDNCTFGIFNVGTNLDARNNRMTDMVTGIDSRNCQNKDITIKQNRITASLTGINMFQNARVKSATIEDNLVIVSDLANIGGLSNATGIRAEEFPVASGVNYKIIENTVNMAHGRRGISLVGGNLISIKDNTVWNSGTVATNGVGIEVVDSRYLPISCNVVDGNSLGFETIGLLVQGTFESRARCNQVTEHNVGINFWGMCDGAQIRGNEMSTASNGFVLGTTSSVSTQQGWIGEQRYRGNLWTGGFSSFPAWFTGVTNPIVASQHRFVIDPNQTPQQLQAQFPTGVQPNGGWFTLMQPNSGENTYVCPSGCGGDPDFPQVLAEFDNQVANGADIGASICINATNWTAKRHLYTRLQDYPGLASGNLLMQGFLSAQANTTVGAFYGIEQQIQQLLTPSSNDESLLGNNRATVDVKSDSIAIIETQIAGGGLTEQQILQLRAQQAQLQSDIAGLQAQSDATLGSIAIQRASTATSIRQTNNSINATQLYEQNQQQVNDIFLQTIAVGNAEFTTQQISTLLSIAEQCVLCGGDGVFMARSLYALAEPTVKFIDAELCAGAQPIKMPGTDEAGMIARIYPNPTTYWALLETNNVEDFNAQVQIFDVTGKLISSFNQTCFANEPSMLDLSSLQSGYYILKMTKDGNIIFSDKIVITR